MNVPIIGAPLDEAPSFTLRLQRSDRVTIVEVVRDVDGQTIAALPFANELWDQLFHAHPATAEVPPEVPDPNGG